MNIPEGVLVSKTNEYVIDYGEYCLVGITDILLSKLGNVIFVEFPEINSFYTKKEVFATIEADGAATELYMPIAGKIIQINPILSESLNALNSEPLSEGWLIKVEPENFPIDSYDLLDYSDYINENK